ncbi:LCP family protein [Bacillaceae bacterium S4-13-58]
MEKKRPNWRKRVLWSVSITILLLIGTVIGYGVYLTDQAKKAADQAHQELDRGELSDKREKNITPGMDNISVLFVGVDDSETRADQGNPRSDALILATFNAENKSVKLLSIPRDSYVYIPVEGKKDKITHAHAFGGINATVETVEEALDIPVDYYVRLNFEAFTEVVDSLDGIYYDVPFDIQEQNSKDEQNAIYIEEGLQHLDGEEALALARTRKYDSDLERGKRQVEIVKAIFSKATTITSVSKYDDIIRSVGNNMKTNLSFDQMLSFRDFALDKDVKFESLQLEGQGVYINQVYYFQLEDENVKDVQLELKHHLGIEPSNISTLANTKEVRSINKEG